MIDRRTGVRYVAPLREGGSLPAIVDTEPAGSYVVKFRGAGQGDKALIAEVIVAALAQTLDLSVPDPAIITLAEEFGRSEPDPEIQDILRGSVGPNFGLAYLSGALAYDPAVDHQISPELAADIVWLDAFVTNVDRTPRNTNLLIWQGKLWLIDHGASLFVHHGWHNWENRIDSPFPQIQDHVLLHIASDLDRADERGRARLTAAVLQQAIADVPGAWLASDPQFPSLDAHRERYLTYLTRRLHGPRHWLQEAKDAKERGPRPHQERVTRRVV